MSATWEDELPEVKAQASSQTDWENELPEVKSLTPASSDAQDEGSEIDELIARDEKATKLKEQHKQAQLNAQRVSGQDEDELVADIQADHATRKSLLDDDAVSGMQKMLQMDPRPSSEIAKTEAKARSEQSTYQKVTSYLNSTDTLLATAAKAPAKALAGAPDAIAGSMIRAGRSVARNFAKLSPGAQAVYDKYNTPDAPWWRNPTKAEETFRAPADAFEKKFGSAEGVKQGKLSYRFVDLVGNVGTLGALGKIAGLVSGSTTVAQALGEMVAVSAAGGAAGHRVEQLAIEKGMIPEEAKALGDDATLLGSFLFAPFASLHPLAQFTNKIPGADTLPMKILLGAVKSAPGGATFGAAQEIPAYALNMKDFSMENFQESMGKIGTEAALMAATGGTTAGFAPTENEALVKYAEKKFGRPIDALGKPEFNRVMKEELKIEPAVADAITMSLNASIKTGMNTKAKADVAGKAEILTEWAKVIANRSQRDNPSMVQMMQPERSAELYSELRRKISTPEFQGMLQKTGGDAEQTLNWLKKQPGLKAEELKWTDTEDFLLDAKKVGKKVGVAELMDHLKENEVRIESLVLGKKPKIKLRERILEEDIIGPTVPGSTHVPEPLARKGQKIYDLVNAVTGENATNDLWYETPEKAMAWQKEYEESYGRRMGTKYSSVSASGPRENYEEWLLKLPNTWSSKAESHALQDAPDTEVMAASSEKRQPYDAPHFGGHGRNLLIHIRVDERMIDGKKTLFVNEVQSDWHQQGRESGYKDEASPVQKARDAKAAEYDALREEQKRLYRQLNEIIPAPAGRLSDEADMGSNKSSLHHRMTAWKNSPEAQARPEIEGMFKTWNDTRNAMFKAGDELVALRDQLDSQVPQAPFSQTWTELAWKKILLEAVARGYDQVAWAPGQLQDKFQGDPGEESRAGRAQYYDEMTPQVVRGLLKGKGGTGDEVVGQKMASDGEEIATRLALLAQKQPKFFRQLQDASDQIRATPTTKLEPYLESLRQQADQKDGPFAEIKGQLKQALRQKGVVDEEKARKLTSFEKGSESPYDDRVRQVATRIYALKEEAKGTPAEQTLQGIHHILWNRLPDDAINWQGIEAQVRSLETQQAPSYEVVKNSLEELKAQVDTVIHKSEPVFSINLPEHVRNRIALEGFPLFQSDRINTEAKGPEPVSPKQVLDILKTRFKTAALNPDITPGIKAVLTKDGHVYIMDADHARNIKENGISQEDFAATGTVTAVGDKILFAGNDAMEPLYYGKGTKEKTKTTEFNTQVTEGQYTYSKPSKVRSMLGQLRDGFMQGSRGSIEFLDTMQAVIRGLKNPDTSTGVHESGHLIAMSILPDALKAQLDTAVGAKPGERWTREHHEKFAELMEKYFIKGEAPSGELVAPFEVISNSMKATYKQLDQSMLANEIPKETQALFDQIFQREREEVYTQRQRVAEIEAQLRRAEEAMNPKAPIPDWVREDMLRQGKNPERVLNDVDAARPKTKEQLANDPVTKFLEKTDPALAERMKRGDLSAKEYMDAYAAMSGKPVKTTDEVKFYREQLKEARATLRRAQETTLNWEEPGRVEALAEVVKQLPPEIPETPDQRFFLVKRLADAANYIHAWADMSAMANTPIGRHFVGMLDQYSAVRNAAIGKYAWDQKAALEQLGRADADALSQINPRTLQPKLWEIMDQVGALEPTLGPLNQQQQVFVNFLKSTLHDIDMGAVYEKVVRGLPSGDQVPVTESDKFRFPRLLTSDGYHFLRQRGRFYQEFITQILKNNPELSRAQVEKDIQDLVADPIRRGLGMYEGVRSIEFMPAGIYDGKQFIDFFYFRPKQVSDKMIDRGLSKILFSKVFGQAKQKDISQNSPGFAKKVKALARATGIATTKSKGELITDLVEATGSEREKFEKRTMADLKSLAKSFEVEAGYDTHDLLTQVLTRTHRDVDGQKNENIIRLIAQRTGGVNTRGHLADVMNHLKRRLTTEIHDDVIKVIQNKFSREGGDVDRLNKIIRVSQGMPEYDLDTTRALPRYFTAAMDVTAGFMTTLSMWKNIPQSFRTAGVTGLGKSLEALMEVTNDWNQAKRDAMLAGAVQDVHYFLKPQTRFHSLRFSAWMRDAMSSVGGMGPISEFLNVHAATAGRLMAQDWKREGFGPQDVANAKRLRLSTDEIKVLLDSKGAGMTEEMFNKIIQNTVKETQFVTEDAHRKGLLEHNPYLKRIFQYNSYFMGVMRANISLVDGMKTAWTSKNPQQRLGAVKSLLAYTGAMLGAGVVSQMLAGKIKGAPSKFDDKDWWEQLLAATVESGLVGLPSRLLQPDSYSHGFERFLTGWAPSVTFLGQAVFELAGQGGKYKNLPFLTRLGKTGLKVPIANAAYNWWQQENETDQWQYRELKNRVWAWRKSQPGYKQTFEGPETPVKEEFWNIYEAASRLDTEDAVVYAKEYYKGTREQKIQGKIAVRALRASLVARRPMNLSEQNLRKFLKTLKPEERTKALNQQRQYMRIVNMVAPTYDDE